MKKLRAVVMAFAVIMMFFALAGCDDTIETVDGTWRSGDGYTLVLKDDTLSLFDQSDVEVLGESMRYYWDGESIYVTIDDVTVRAFEANLDEDTLTLDYSEEIIAMMDAGEQATITLERTQD